MNDRERAELATDLARGLLEAYEEVCALFEESIEAFGQVSKALGIEPPDVTPGTIVHMGAAHRARALLLNLEE